MTNTSLPTTGTADLGTMARIEARRFARQPAFLVGVALALGVTGLLYVLLDDRYLADTLSMPVVPAFFIGLTSLLAAARLTRSTSSAQEAVGTAPGTEARRTAALALACLVPFTAGLAYLGLLLVMARTKGIHPDEWWFDTMPDWQVWAILVAAIPVACLGGALLGVLTGRWLAFPAASVVVLVATVAVTMAGQLPLIDAHPTLRLWVPWVLWHSGTEPEDGAAILGAGNPAFYIGYALCLCAAAVIVALWHDRTARGPRLRAAFAAVVVVGLACLALTMTTGNDENLRSDPIPYRAG